jgi:hypothetical protein
MALDVERILLTLYCGQHVKRRSRLGCAKVKRWWIVTVSEKHDPRAWHLDNNRVFGMLSINMLKFDDDLPELDGHETIKDYIWNDYAECCPIPNGTLARPVTHAEARIAFYLLKKILRPPRLSGFFSENGLAH